jgi:hypothetical protein
MSITTSAPRPIIIALLLAALILGHEQTKAATEISQTRISEIAAWLPAKPKGFGPPATDRGVWGKLAEESASASVISRATELAAKPIPAVSDNGFLDYSRTGNRDRYQAILFARSDRLSNLTLAECLENKGRFIGPLTNTIASFCEERTWVYPAHDGKLNNFYGPTVDMDLRATAVAWDLGMTDYLLGEKLPPGTRQLIRENVRRRVLLPFRDMVEGRRNPIHWMRATHNWNAVCLAGVTGAALTLEDSREDRAVYVAAAERYIRYFLSGFTPDGYCSEGVGYWNYGFGHFLMLGEAMRQATGGHVDLLADPAAQAPALFCMRDEIIDGVYPTISDCSPGGRPSSQFVEFIRARFGIDSDVKTGVLRPDKDLVGTMMFTFPDKPLPLIHRAQAPASSPLRTWFTNGGVLICRAPEKGFAAALKGGHNAENHNHNDVGSFSLVLGRTMVICDPGSEVYTARTFGSHRYDSKVLNSFGHAVPVVAGNLQRTGADARAVVLHTDFGEQRDTLAMDIRSAYPEPALKKLERTFVFDRADPSLTVIDEVQFAEAKPFETALITWGEWKRVSDNEISIRDGKEVVRVRIETDNIPFTIKSETLDENVHTPKKPVRIGIALKEPLREAKVSLRVIPEKL